MNPGARLWLSVIIPVSDADQRDLGDCLLALAACREPGMEVILAERGTGRAALAQARALAGQLPYPLILLNQPGQGPGAARNLAAARAQGETLFFTLPQGRVAPEMPAVLRGHFSHGECGGVGGEVRADNPQAPLAVLSALELAFASQPGQTEEAPCPDLACAAFPADDFKAAGMCDETLGQAAGPDRDLCARLGGLGKELRQDSRLWVRRALPGAWPQVWQWQAARGKANYNALKQGRRLAWGDYLQPALILLALGLLLALGPQDPARALTLAAICLLLLYPLNRAFLAFVGQREPHLLSSALLLCLMRPVAWTWGMLGAALRRIGGQAGA
ncbi:hypothetical protein AAU61_19040 [Desulfocarbo indianensis]|nr:hypothetical protein AAU61_19040 [Desulfocarbo indianensis]